MPVDRPTFSESWYRVAPVKPRLRSTLGTYRQHYRGNTYYVIQDTTANQYFRLDDAGYHFVGLLDGRRTVAQAWDICNEHLGDRAPTQNEVIQLLGQLYSANLLQADLTPDAEGMFERYKTRTQREVKSYLMNILFMRLPLFDPDWILTKWAQIMGVAFTWFGFAIWLVIVLAGMYHLIDRWDRLFVNAASLLEWNPERLGILYCCFSLIKAWHEFGHGFACKTFGLRNGSGGEVHTMGIMFLVGVPVPYVDCSSAWAFRSRWQRIIVGAGGMYFELVVASIAAMIWARTSEGTLINAVSYNVIFVASVSTILFNANPLLRYDGYYMLADWLEIPNLAQRAKDYMYYLARRYAYGVKRARTTVQTASERFWLLTYGSTSSIYRVFISLSIMLFVADKLFFVGAILAAGSIFGWVIAPTFKFINYLATSPELTRVRGRAVLISAVAITAIALLVGVASFPEYSRAEGVVEPLDVRIIYMGVSGFLEESMPTDREVDPTSAPVVMASNRELEAEREQVQAQLKMTGVQLRQSLSDEPALQQTLRQKLAALMERRDQVDQQISDLCIIPPIKGVWVAPDLERTIGAHYKRGAKVGVVASTDALTVRVVADQKLGPRLGKDVLVGAPVELRVRGHPDSYFFGTVDKILHSSQEQLPSAALGYAVGGQTMTANDDRSGTRAKEQFFEVRIVPVNAETHAELAAEKQKSWWRRVLMSRLPQPTPTWGGLSSGQRVIVRFNLGERPLVYQWWLVVRQLLQRRYGM